MVINTNTGFFEFVCIFLLLNFCPSLNQTRTLSTSAPDGGTSQITGTLKSVTATWVQHHAQKSSCSSPSNWRLLSRKYYLQRKLLDLEDHPPPPFMMGKVLPVALKTRIGLGNCSSAYGGGVSVPPENGGQTPDIEGYLSALTSALQHDRLRIEIIQCSIFL